jgi:hypothetical protein
VRLHEPQNCVRTFCEQRSGSRIGIGRLAGQEEPPLRFAAGADAVTAVERRANNLLAQANAYRELSSSLALDSD